MGQINLTRWLTSLDQDHDEARQYGRIRTEDLSCSCGEVVDMSGGGLRIVRRGFKTLDIGDKGQIVLQIADRAMSLAVRCVRIDKVGIMKHSYAFEFIDLEDSCRSELVKIAHLAADRKIMDQD